jgi:hypothetical protein
VRCCDRLSGSQTFVSVPQVLSELFPHFVVRLIVSQLDDSISVFLRHQLSILTFLIRLSFLDQVYARLHGFPSVIGAHQFGFEPLLAKICAQFSKFLELVLLSLVQSREKRCAGLFHPFSVCQY